MAGTFLFFYFRSLENELTREWEIVLDSLRLRLDKIPNLLETVRSLAAGQEKLVEELVKLRAASWPMEESGRTKVQNELVISEKLKAVWAMAGKFPDLARDTNFLALRTEFKEIGQEIENEVEAYNKRVRKHNKRVRFILFLPFSLLFRFKKAPVFEFEV